MNNNPTLEQAIEWNNTDEQTTYVMENFDVLSCDSELFGRIELKMKYQLFTAGIELK